MKEHDSRVPKGGGPDALASLLYSLAPFPVNKDILKLLTFAAS